MRSGNCSNWRSMRLSWRSARQPGWRRRRGWNAGCWPSMRGACGQRGSFGWVRPEHMEPTGVPSAEVRSTLREQLGECLILLERLDGGVGAVCRVTMTVNELGKIDLYQWLYFLAQHARRHLQQLAAIEAELASGPLSNGEPSATADRGHDGVPGS